MFDLGDEFMLDNHRIPWLIWIQILVMFLLTLTILFAYFGFFAIDSSSTSNSSGTVSPTSVTHSQRTQVAGNHGAGREIVTVNTNRTRCVENNSEREGSSMKDLGASLVGGRFFHPCRYFDFAKQAFLKCLGLGSTSHNFPDKEHEHQD